MQGVAPGAAQLHALPPAIRTVYLAAFTSSFSTVFPVAAGVSLAAFLLA